MKLKLEKLLNAIEPYDVTYNKNSFLKELHENPVLRKSLEKQLHSNSDWIQATTEKSVKFIFDERPKDRFPHESTINLKFVGPDATPTVEVTVWRDKLSIAI